MSQQLLNFHYPNVNFASQLLPYATAQRERTLQKHICLNLSAGILTGTDLIDAASQLWYSYCYLTMVHDLNERGEDSDRGITNNHPHNPHPHSRGVGAVEDRAHEWYSTAKRMF